MEGLGYLFAAYTVVWLVFAGYLWRLSRRITLLRRDLEELSELSRSAQAAPPSTTRSGATTQQGG